MSRSFREGIEAQPENLRAGAALLADALAELDLAPLRTGTIVFSGIGASWHALLPVVRALRAAGRRAFAVPAPELAGRAHLADAYVLVSQSGTSTEVLAALEGLGNAPVYAVSARGEEPLARRAGKLLPLGPLEDTAVSTLSYTATLQTLGMLCDAILQRDETAGWAALPELAQLTLERHDAAAAELASGLAAVRSIDAVGSGSAVASAGETALLVREALRLPSHGAETRQYLHGELEAVEKDFGCVLFGGERERSLATTLQSFGASVCLIGEQPAASPAVISFTLPHASDTAAPILQILPVQLIVSHAAAERGLPVQALRRAQQDTKTSAAE
jgi:glucosamine--fructose-6-phosphate aminotransferase (isomerizing)